MNIPIAKLLRNNRGGKAKKKPIINVLTDIEKQIKLLEDALNESDDYEDNDEPDVLMELDEKGNVCKVTTPIPDDLLIKPLPKNMLPAPNCTKKNNFRSANEKIENLSSTSRVRFETHDSSNDKLKDKTDE